MRRRMAFFCIMILLFAVFGGCGPAKEQTPDNRQGSGRLRIVTSVFPIYDWTRNILGEDHEGVELTLLLDSGVDLHSYQPSAKDIKTILDCDLFIYVGGESDGWVREALAQAADPDMVVINLMDVLGDSAREEEEIEGMQEERGEEEDGPAYDEHVWLSLKNAAVFCDAIADGLAKLDPEHAENYRRNAAAFKEKLTALDAAYQTAIDDAPGKTLLFADRFPFRYLTADYGLDYYAAFQGCSAETEASFKTILFLIEKADELDLSCVLTLESAADQRLAETVARNTAAGELKILTLNSLQGITAEIAAAGATYLAIMEKNLEVLKEALR